VKRDEAKAWLTAVGSLANTPLLVWEFARKFLPLATIILIIWSITLAGLTRETGCCRSSYDAVIWIVVFFVLVSSVTMLIPIASIGVSTFFRGNKFAFGWEGWLTHLVLDLSPAASPPKGIHSEVYELDFWPATYSSLRHCAFYDDEWFVERLLSWLRGCKPPEVRVTPRSQETTASVPWKNPVAVALWFLIILLILASVFPLTVVTWTLGLLFAPGH
jgi:hypothetical protein